MIEEKIQNFHPDYANGSLSLACVLVEAWKAGINTNLFRSKVLAWIKSIEINSWSYRRSPGNAKQSSHDEWLGLLILDALYDLGIANKLLNGPMLWITGTPHDVKLKMPIDSEWFTPIRPEYRGLAKIVAKRKFLFFARFWVRLNLRFSTTWNLMRARLLLLEILGEKNLEKFSMRLGDKYKGYYGQNEIMLELWGMQK